MSDGNTNEGSGTPQEYNLTMQQAKYVRDMWPALAGRVDEILADYGLDDEHKQIELGALGTFVFNEIKSAHEDVVDDWQSSRPTEFDQLKDEKTDLEKAGLYSRTARIIGMVVIGVGLSLGHSPYVSFVGGKKYLQE